MSILADLLALQAKAPVQVTEAEDLTDEEIHGMVEELEHLHETMVKAAHEAKDIVRHLPSHLRGSAESYWIPHILIALGGDHDYMANRGDSTMLKTITDLKEEAGPDEDHDEDHGGHEGSEGDDGRHRGSDRPYPHHGQS
jgi:ABC-type proline/glycine betaine transport system substrate-binding protein